MSKTKLVLEKLNKKCKCIEQCDRIYCVVYMRDFPKAKNQFGFANFSIFAKKLR